MGVKAEITLYALDQDTATAAAAHAFERLAELDQILSDYRPTSELNQLCDAFAPGSTSVRPVPRTISLDLARVLDAAAGIATLTDGAFDPTIAPLVTLWREARRTRQLPPPDVLAATRARVGWQRLHVDPAARTAWLEVPPPPASGGVRLDLGAIAKGYAASEGVESLQALGVPICMVALAGDIAVGDAPPGEAGWRIAVDTGARTSAPPRPRVLLLRNQAVSTSGVSEQFIEIAGVRYAHILDPATGLGLTRRVGSTVVAPRGEITDALDTAVCVRPDRAWEWAQALPNVGVILEETGDSSTRQAVYGTVPWANEPRMSSP